MKKFIIIDQSLCNLKGHHYECSISVAEAAQKLGYEAIIIANKNFSQELYPDKIKVFSIFEVDWFNNSTIENDRPFWQKLIKQINNFLDQFSLKQLYQDLVKKIDYKLLKISLTNQSLKSLREKIKGSIFRLKNWFKKDIQLIRYIPFTNTVWGLLKIILGMVKFILRIISKIINKIWFKVFNFEPRKFTDSLQEILKKIEISSQDNIFIHTLGIEQLEELLYYLESSNYDSIPQYHLMLRRDIKDFLVTQAKGIGLEAILNRFYNSKLWYQKVKFYTDTQQLVARYNSVSPIKFTEIPVPFRQEKLIENKQIEIKNKTLHIVYLGDARREKGYHLLPQIIETLYKDYIATNKIKFTIQSNFNINKGEVGILEAKLKLKKYPETQIKVIDKEMDADSYYQLLANADIVLLPYDTESYRYRTSGVFTESLAAGKPVIIPANSWLVTQVNETISGIYKKEEDIYKTIIKVINNIEKYTKSAAEFSLTWRQKHLSTTLINTLLNTPNYDLNFNTNKEKINKFQSIGKILYIAEGDNLINSSINQLISLTHLEYLSNYGYEIYLIIYPLDNQFREENFIDFTNRIKQIITNYKLANYWILNYGLTISFLDEINNINKDKYFQEVYENKWSFSRNLIDINSLEMPCFLADELAVKNLDGIFLDNIASEILVKKLNLSKIPLITQVYDLYSYRYAIENQKDLDELEFNLEIKLLQKSQFLLFKEQFLLTKIQEIINSNSCYLLPPTISLNKEVNLLEKNHLINFIWQHKNLTYQELINNILQKVFSSAKVSLPNIPSNKAKIAILYPWQDILERKAGSSQRVGLLIDYLQSQNHLIWIFSTGGNQEVFKDNLRFSFYEQDFDQLDFIKEIYTNIYQSSCQLNLNKKENTSLFTQDSILDISQDWRLSMYYQFRFDRHFITWIEEITDWADIVFLEYPFWAKTVGKICEKKGVKLIVTAHDVIYKQVNQNSMIKDVLLAEEISSLAIANKVICVSPEDQILLAKYGINSNVICNPVELPNLNKFKANFSDLEVIKKYNWITKNYCLFVGSYHFPNLEAVNLISNMAAIFKQKYTHFDCNFIVIGSCCNPEIKDNFMALGKIDSELLAMLYNQANLVISPMLSGTGSSLKIIEAMSYGKAILGTKIAFRGYPVESNFNCIIDDSIQDYTDIIYNLLLDGSQLNFVEKNARSFAESYDYRELYQYYDQLAIEVI